MRIQGGKLQGAGTDFGHEALGKLGNRRVEVGQGAFSRVEKYRQMEKGVGGLSRFVNSVTPQGVRVESKLRAGLEDFSKELGEALGALVPDKEGRLDTRTFMDHLVALREKAEPLLKRGVDFPTLLKERLALNLSNLSDQGLAALAEGLAKPELQELYQALKDGPTKEMRDLVSTLGSLDLVDPAKYETIGQARDLSLIAHAVMEARQARLKSSLENMNQHFNRLENHPTDPSTKPREYLAELNKGQRLVATVETKAQGLGFDALDDVGRHKTFIQDRFEADKKRFLQQAQEALQRPIDPEDDPNGRVEQISKALNLYYVVQKSAEALHSEVPRELSDLRERFREVLNGEGIREMDVSDLTPGNLHGLEKALDSFELDHLKGPIEERKQELLEEAGQRFSKVFASQRKSLESGDPFEIVQALTVLAEPNDEMVRLKEDLSGSKITGKEDRAGIYSSLLNDALADMDTRQAKALATALQSGDVSCMIEALHEGGAQLVDRHGVGITSRVMGLSWALNLMRMAVGERLAKDGIEMEPAPLAREDSLSRPPQGLDKALRKFLGVSIEKGHMRLCGYVGKPPDPFNPSLKTGIRLMLDSLAGSPPSPFKLTASCVSVESRGVGREEDRLDDMQDEVSRCNREQLSMLLSNLNSEEVLELRHTLRMAQQTASPTASREEIKARSELIVAGMNLDTLEQAVRERMDELDMEVPPPMEPAFPEGHKPGQEIQSAFDTALSRLMKRRTIEHVEQQGVFEGGRTQLFNEKFQRPVEQNEELNNPLTHLEGEPFPFRVCRQFHTDWNRQGIQIVEDGEPRRVFTGKSEEDFREGVELLSEFCGGNQDDLMRLSRYANQATFAGVLNGLGFDKEYSLAQLSDGRKIDPHCLGKEKSVTFSRTPEGDYKMQVKIALSFKGFLDKDAEVVPLDPNQSGIECSFEATLGKDGKLTFTPVQYHYALTRSPDIISPDDWRNH